MGLRELIEVNKHIIIKETDSPDFLSYGRKVSGYDFSMLIEYMENETDIPKQGVFYKASEPELESFEVRNALMNRFYGEMPIQIGYCNGNNSTLNGLEYHIGSEINIAVTDLVLILGRITDIRNNQYDAQMVDVFYVRKGTAVQLYETTLHFAPCKVNNEGFKCLVILPEGTNQSLEKSKSNEKSSLLFARNKWLLAHPERTPLIEKGAYPGIVGDNIEIKIS